MFEIEGPKNHRNFQTQKETTILHIILKHNRGISGKLEG